MPVDSPHSRYAAFTPSTGGIREPLPRHKRHQKRAGLSLTANVAPMIDMTFLFLIFFLVTTTFERAEGLLSADLPRDRGQPAVALPISPIVVRLQATPDGEGVHIRLDGFDHLPVDLSLLPDALRQIHQQPGFDTETPVVIIAEDAVAWDHVVGAWNAALRADCRKVAFAEP